MGGDEAARAFFGLAWLARDSRVAFGLGPLGLRASTFLGLARAQVLLGLDFLFFLYF